MAEEKEATHKKIITGCVIQTYAGDECIDQEFEAGAEVEYEDVDGTPLDSIEVDVESEEYQPMNMVAPGCKIVIKIMGGLITEVGIPAALAGTTVVVRDYDTDGFTDEADLHTDEDGGTYVEAEWE